MGKYRKKPLQVPLFVIVALCVLLGAAIMYYAKPAEQQPMRTMTIASLNKAVVATISSTSVFISEVSYDDTGNAAVTLSNGDTFWLEGKDLSFSPESTEVKCSDPIVATPDLKVMTCKGVNFDLNFAWNKQP